MLFLCQAYFKDGFIKVSFNRDGALENAFIMKRSFIDWKNEGESNFEFSNKLRKLSTETNGFYVDAINSWSGELMRINVCFRQLGYIIVLGNKVFDFAIIRVL